MSDDDINGIDTLEQERYESTESRQCMNEQAPKAVYSAIAEVMKDLSRQGVAKGRQNTQQGYAFRGIDDAYNALAPILARHGLAILPRILKRTQELRKSAKGSDLSYVVVEAEFDLVAAADGSQHVVRTFGEAMDGADKATNKAMSAAYKYMAFQTFCIPTEGDNDADASTHEPLPQAMAQADINRHQALILGAADAAALKLAFADAYNAAKLALDQDALAVFTAAKDERKGELALSPRAA